MLTADSIWRSSRRSPVSSARTSTRPVSPVPALDTEISRKSVRVNAWTSSARTCASRASVVTAANA
nr:hypothetical protein [Nocardia xishanensis]